MLQRAKKLHTIEGVYLADGSVCRDELAYGNVIGDHFSTKWGVGRLQDRMNIMDFVIQHDGAGPSFSDSELSNAFTVIWRKPRMDHYSVSVSAIQMLHSAVPNLARRFLEMLAASTPLISTIIIKGRVYGKENCVTQAKDTRAILPLPSIMQILDALLSRCAHDLLSRFLPSQPECFIGVLPKTQCLDIAHGIQYVLEKGLDDFGRAAAAQCDIEKFYDSLPVMTIARFLIAKGMNASLASSLVRHQMCPQVALSCGSSNFSIGRRSIGGLTGSRVAGFLGRVPVEAIISERTPHWRKWGFSTGRISLCMSTWVDNLFSVSSSLPGALAILEDFETFLQRDWRMKIKDKSRSCIVAQGCNDEPANAARWPLLQTFEVLGHTLQSSGSIRACWSKTKRSMWYAFWSNPGSNSARKLSAQARLRLLQRAVTPGLDFRCSRWPPQPQIAKEVDSLQRKMVGSIVNVPRWSGELVGDFVRRRGRNAARLCREHGVWSDRWFKRAVLWDEHLQRPQNSNTWSAKLRAHRDRLWFVQRRASLLPLGQSWSSSVTGGRTRTRTLPGKVHTRWPDGIFFATSRVSS